MDETPKGWYVQYIDRDPETIRRQEELERKKKQDMDDEERSAKFIEEQVRRGREGKEPEVCLCTESVLCIILLRFSLSVYLQEEPVFTELKRMNEEEKVAFNLDIALAGPSKTRYNQSRSLIKQHDCSVGDNNYLFLFL